LQLTLAHLQRLIQNLERFVKKLLHQRFAFFQLPHLTTSLYRQKRIWRRCELNGGIMKLTSQKILQYQLATSLTIAQSPQTIAEHYH